MSTTIIIIILTGLVSYRCFSDRTLFENLKHSPYREANYKEYYRIITSGFVHADLMHLLFNMYVLYIFGEYIENTFKFLMGNIKGTFSFLMLYFGSMIIADAATFARHRNNPSFASIGASGAVSGILFAFILFDPWQMLYLFFAIPIPAIIFAVGYLAYSSWASKNSQSRIDHSAHFMGAVGGLLLTIVMFPEVIQIFINEFLNIPF